MANFVSENKEGYSVIRMMSERLDNQTTAELRSELVLLAGNNVKNMVLDLGACHYCDTSGLSAILIAHRLCKDGFLVLACVSDEVEKMLSIQRFEPELIVEATLPEAEARIKSQLSN